MRKYTVALIEGDGIGAEVVPEAVAALDAAAKADGGFQLEYRTFDWGSERYLREGNMMPDDALSQLADCDSIFLGPVGDPRVPDHITLWGLLLPIRQGFDQYINLRPVKLLRGVRGPLRDRAPGDIDMVCVRENTEGEYSGAGGRIHRGRESEVAVQTTIFTRQGTERVIRYAFEYARTHNRKRVTSATKSNSMQHNMVFWDDVFAAVAADYPDVEHNQYLIDALSARFVTHPQTIDVIVASNLFGDILSDLAGAICGSLGLAPSANINPERRYPSLFQAVHGSAPDIFGRGIANPSGEIWSAALMLEFLGETEAGDAIFSALEEIIAEGQSVTGDLGGKAKTREMGQAVVERVMRDTPS